MVLPSNTSFLYNFKHTLRSPWPLNLHNFKDSAGFSVRFINFVVEKFPDPIINLLFPFPFWFFPYLPPPPGTTGNLLPGDLGAGKLLFDDEANVATLLSRSMNPNLPEI